MPYVITKNGDIIWGRRNGNGKTGLPPTLIDGHNPDVTMAGMLRINSEKIATYDAHSGHFKPNKKSTPVAHTTFRIFSVFYRILSLFHRLSPSFSCLFTVSSYIA
jgi:hypothetical protein